MANVLFLLAIVVAAVVIVSVSRNRRDRSMFAAKARELGGELVRARRAKKGHPFPDTGRGWWAWQVTWRNARGERVSWALTDREGIKEWRD